MRQNILLIFLILLLTGCTVGRGTGVFPPAADLNAQPPLGSNDDGRDYRILVANGLSETITLIERNDGTWNVSPDILPTGQAPNQFAIRDGICYLVNSLSNAIQVIDPKTLTTIREISTGAGTNPMFMDFVDDTTAFVTCYITNEVLLVDLKTETEPENRIIERIPLPDSDELPHDEGVTTNARPGGLAVVDNRCFVACSNLQMAHMAGGPGVLIEIDIPTLSISAIHELTGRDTTQVIHSPRFPERLIILSAGDYDFMEGFIGNGVVESLDLETGEIFQVIEIDGAPFGGAIGPDDILLMENGKESALLRVDLRDGIELQNFKLPTYGEPLSYASALLGLQGLICVTNFNADRLYLLDPNTGDILAELATGDGPDAIILDH